MKRLTDRLLIGATRFYLVPSLSIFISFLTGSFSSAHAEIYGGVDFPAGAVSFADVVVLYEPGFGGGPVPDITQQDARQILGVPEQGGMSLGNGGRITAQFTDNALTGSDDAQSDLWVFEVGVPETTFVEISKDGVTWHAVGAVTGFASGIDIDQFGFGKTDLFAFVRLTDDGDEPGVGGLTPGADLQSVGASSSGPPVTNQPPILYEIQAHISGRSQLIVSGSTLQWHHLKGVAPGQGQAFWSFDSDANSPTIVDSNQGPNIPWIPDGWPPVLGNGTHPESFSSIFNALTPVFPSGGKPWTLKQLWGKGTTKIVQQPNDANAYTLVIEFDDLETGAIPELSGASFYAVRLTPVEEEILVAIDIKPGNKRNVINPRAIGGIWVAVLSDSDFDPLQIKTPTLRFGPDEAEVIHHRVQDINRDGLGDLVLRFGIPETGIACGDTDATLTGATSDGQSIMGTDSIKTVGCWKN